jgi:hypothetical protein
MRIAGAGHQASPPCGQFFVGQAAGRINHAYAHTTLKPLVSTLLLGESASKKLSSNLLKLMGRETCLHREIQSKERKLRRKPHNNL